MYDRYGPVGQSAMIRYNELFAKLQQWRPDVDIAEARKYCEKMASETTLTTHAVLQVLIDRVQRGCRELYKI